MWAMSPNIRIKLDKRLKSDLRGEKGEISARKKNIQSRERSSNFSLRSTELGCSVFVKPRTKVHLLDEDYAWVPKKEISLGIQVRSLGNKRFRV